MSEERHSAFQCVSQALHFDARGIYQHAFEKYLESIQTLSGYLNSKVKREGIPSNKADLDDVKKIISVTQQCLERLQNLLSEAGKIFCYPSYDSLSAHQRSLRKNVEQKPEVAKTNSEQIRLLSVPSVSCLSWSPLIKRKKSSSEPCLQKEESFSPRLEMTSRKKLSPIEQAKRENAVVKKVFDTRISQEKDPQKRTNLKLALQRKITENLALAEAKEATYKKKLKEKEELAILKAQRRYILPSQLPENDERRQLVFKILDYEQKETWPSNLKKELNLLYKNPDVIVKVITQTLSSQDHPLKCWAVNMQLWLRQRMQNVFQWNINLIKDLPGDLFLETASGESARDGTLSDNDDNQSDARSSANFILNNCKMNLHDQSNNDSLPTNSENAEEPPAISSNKSFQKATFSSNSDSLNFGDGARPIKLMGPSNVQNNIDAIVEDISLCVEIINQVLSLVYEPLAKEEAQGIVYRTVEKYFLEPIWDMVLMLFRLSNFQSEHCVARAMSTFKSCPPSELGIRNLCNINSSMFQESVTRLRTVSTHRSLIAKIETLVQVVHYLCDASEDVSEGLFGADDLIPLLSYALVQCSLPQLVSECQALDHLIDPRYLKGEEGYSLTSVQMALKYLETAA